MNCTINSASNFSGLQAGISQISPAQLAAPVRKSTLNRPFISPILLGDGAWSTPIYLMRRKRAHVSLGVRNLLTELHR